MFFAPDFARSFFTTSMLSPPVEVVPAAISAMVVKHAGHIGGLLRSLQSLATLSTSVVACFECADALVLITNDVRDPAISTAAQKNFA
jgi:hypothetical protein